MGGEKEVEIAKSKVDTKSQETSFGIFRIHINNGEMHFHDDVNKLKAAIPVAKGWKLWEKLSTEFCEVKHIDMVNKTVLTLISTIFPDQSVEVVAAVSPVKIGDNFKKLSEFFKK